MRVLALALLLGQPAAAGPWRGVQRAIEKSQSSKLSRLVHNRHAYVRERACRGLRALSPSLAGPLTEVVRAQLKAADERGYVRAECALTLAAWRVEDAVPDIIEAMAQVDAEARYWMASALHQLDTREARAQLQSLSNDPDLFLSASAREWTQ